MVSNLHLSNTVTNGVASMSINGTDESEENVTMPPPKAGIIKRNKKLVCIK